MKCGVNSCDVSLKQDEDEVREDSEEMSEGGGYMCSRGSCTSVGGRKILPRPERDSLVRG
eukprot:760371-Hanusia_phi.AAC.2